MNNKDIVVIIPSYKSMSTIEKLLDVIDSGLQSYFPKKKSIIVIIDSSGLETRLVIQNKAKLLTTPTKLIFSNKPLTKAKGIIKGFSIAQNLSAKAVVTLDSDHKNIEPNWIHKFLHPILDDNLDFVGPRYVCNKYSNLLTDNIIYPLIKTFLNADLRQPISGDFAFSGKIINFYLLKKDYQKEVGNYCIDIWLNFVAFANKFRTGQIYLGVKDYEIMNKPARNDESFCNMFVEHINPLFKLLVRYQKEWKKGGFHDVLVINNTVSQKPPDMVVDFLTSWQTFKRLYPKYCKYYPEVLSDEIVSKIEKIYRSNIESNSVDIDLWAIILTSYLKNYSRSKNKKAFISSLIPIYFARVSAFIKEINHLSSQEVEQKIIKDMKVFVKYSIGLRKLKL